MSSDSSKLDSYGEITFVIKAEDRSLIDVIDDIEYKNNK